MKIPAVKGTRDFYPEQMRLRNWIIDGWKEVSLRNGFEEYDGPIFEYLKMYQQKSGEEIAEQLFSFEDRGGRALAIRPEITPTFARMVNQQINTLPKPVKWFSVPRVCRAERPQKGRLREFFQWNIDIVGVDEIIADAEVIFCAIDYLRQCGLGSKDVVAKVSSRKMLAAMLEAIGVAEDDLVGVYAVLDKRAKLSDEAFEEMLAKKLQDSKQRELVTQMMNAENFGDLEKIIELPDEAAAAIAEMKELFELLDAMGIADYCKFDISIVRGLAYYTGVVFEIHDRCGELRAVCGGGRYDNLLKDFGGPAMSATGMGMGDCVLEILLREKGIITDQMQREPVDFYIASLDEGMTKPIAELAAKLRCNGKKAEFAYKKLKMKKLLKQADELKAAKCIILGREFIESEMLVVKDMKTSEQEQVSYEQFISGI
ncbi:MAG: histidine--tRNA ligase [Sedimentisphaeraceae bacterium JB056]